MSHPDLVLLPDHRKLAYQEYGDLKGYPIFFFHGWPSSRLQARRFHKVANSMGIRLISPDRPGYGFSDYKPNRTLLDWSKDIEVLADSLQIDTFSVIGVSGGAPYAAVCAYAVPKRIKKVAIVVGLSPINIHGVLRGMAPVNKVTWYLYHKIPYLLNFSASFHYLRQRCVPKITTGFLPSSFDKKAITTSLQNELAAIRSEAYRQGIQGTAKDLELYIHDWGFNLDDITVTVDLWYGEDDKNVSVEMGKHYNKCIPKSNLRVLPETGHLLLDLYAKDVFGKLVAE